MTTRLALVVALLGFSAAPAGADPAPESGDGERWSVGLAGGWGFALPFPDPDDDTTDSRLVSIAPRWARPVRAFTEGSAADGRLDLGVEGTLLLQHGPQDGWAAGGKLLLRYDFDGRGRFRPYLEAGLGALHLDFDFDEQSDGFNFSIVGGAGLRWPLSRTLVLDTGLRFHHISNAGTQLPNVGLNLLILGVGVSWGPGGR